MELFNIIVGVFSILGSIAAIVSLFVVISISNKITITGNNNNTSNIMQNNKGKNNKNEVK